jgi:2-polyprenyl-3-methyl-5-hydroxy-6-metoxy-1,4-benzoquinol methylase
MNSITEVSTDYAFPNSEGDHTCHYLWQPVIDALRKNNAKSVFDLGCGNGAFVRFLNASGFAARGVDPSSQGVAMAKKTDSHAPIEQGSGYEPLADKYGQFDAVVSLEVIGHVYYPRKFLSTIFDLTKPGGTIAISTPYHGYLKNLLIALMGHFDTHVSPLWDHGIIKLWSISSLTTLLEERQLENISVTRLGRIPPIAKTMLFTCKKPG